jgi:hypothetical protein
MEEKRQEKPMVAPGAISVILDRDQLSILGRLLKHKMKDGLRELIRLSVLGALPRGNH